MAATVDAVTERRIDLTARAPLWTGDVEAAGYGLYSYLLFGSSSEAAYHRRLAAACAYLSVIPDRAEPAIQELSSENLNIFYVPLRSSSYRRDVLTTQDAAWLVANYDYSRASLLLGRIGEEGDDIYLVSYRERLTRVEAPEADQLLVQDLSLVSLELVELWVKEFRRQIRREAYWDEFTFRQAMLRLRSALPHVARYVAFAGEAIGIAFPKPALAAADAPTASTTSRCETRAPPETVESEAD
jgi:hypothetical protein